MRVEGALAIALALAVMTQRRVWLWPWKLPLAPRMYDALYRLVARYRYRLPGVTPWCVEHPEACEPLRSE